MGNTGMLSLGIIMATLGLIVAILAGLGKSGLGEYAFRVLCDRRGCSGNLCMLGNCNPESEAVCVILCVDPAAHGVHYPVDVVHHDGAAQTPLAMQSQWYVVALGGAVTLACVLFGELVVRKQN